MASQSFFDDSVQIRDAAQQKRKKARTGVNIAAEFVLKGQGQPVECTVTDLGTGGLSINTRSTMYMGDQIEVRMRLGKEALSVPCTVVRVSGKSIGLQFDRLPEQQMEYIQHYIHSTFFDKKDQKKKP
ncbi:MAG: PilZ domain-containing protein [bacterium]|nr:PilZ domain-containing protein [bacterium]